MTTLMTMNQIETATANSFAMFVPNKPSVGTLIISPGIHSELYNFLQNYFFWKDESKSIACYKPYACAGAMLEEIEEEGITSPKLPTDEEDVLPFASIDEWLKTVVENYGKDTIVICSHYQ